MVHAKWQAAREADEARKRARADGERVVRRALEVKAGDPVEILLAEGVLDCRVEGIREDERPRPVTSVRVGEEHDDRA